MEWYISVIKKYAVFEGRARRKEYWMFFLFNFIFSIAASILDRIFHTISAQGTGLISSLYSLFVLLPSIGVAIRRLHDIGKSGWYIFINLIPIIGWIWFIILLAADSDPDANMYGPNPKENDFTNYGGQPGM